MKTYITALLLSIVPLVAQSDSEQGETKGTTIPQRYEIIPIHHIESYCGKHYKDVATWLSKRKKTIVPRHVAKSDSEIGDVLNKEELLAGQISYFMNLLATQGWRVVSLSKDYIVFERVGTNREK